MNSQEAFLTQISSEFKLRVHEFSAYAQALLQPDVDEMQKFIIFAHYRTGSTLLADLLNCHPQIFCDGEIFLKFVLRPIGFRKVLLPKLYVKHCCRKANTKIYGFDLKLHQFEVTNIRQLHGNSQFCFETLFKKNWKIIHLKRYNLFHHALSNYCANKRKIWAKTQETNQDLFSEPIYVDVQALLEELNWHERMFQSELTVLRDIPHLTLEYEKDLLKSEQHQTTANKVFAYLNIESVSVQTKFQKIASSNLADDIINYEEVVESIQKTPYAHFLDM